MLRIDHVVLAVRDLTETGERLELRHGLASVPGGRHARWGTANRIVPLGDTYVELISVVDPSVGRTTPLGRTLLGLTRAGDAWFALCLADDDIDGTASRLGVAVEPGSRERDDGLVVRWRGAAIEDPRRTPDLPFFIAWDTPELHPGRTAIDHAAGDCRLVRIDVAGDGEAFRRWTGDAELPVRFVEGQTGVRAVEIETDAGPVRLEASLT